MGLFEASTASNQRGGSIIEVVVMSGVMVAMLTGFMSLMSHESKNVAYLEDKLSRVALENELRVHFGSGDFCGNLLTGLVVPLNGQTKDIAKTLTQAVQKAALGQIFKKRGDKTVYDQLEISKISLEESNLSSPNSSGMISLLFYPERIRQGGGPPSLQPIKIKTAVSVDADYKIKSCSAENESDDAGKSCKISDLESTKVPKPPDPNHLDPHYYSQRVINLGKGPKVLHGSFALLQIAYRQVSYEKGPKIMYTVKTVQAQCNDGNWVYPGTEGFDETMRRGRYLNFDEHRSPRDPPW